MPRQTNSVMEEKEKGVKVTTQMKDNDATENARLNRMLGDVMKYISNEEIQEIDIEYILEQTDGLREWWGEYQKHERKRVEEAIKKSLNELSLDELEKISEKIREKRGEKSLSGAT